MLDLPSVQGVEVPTNKPQVNSMAEIAAFLRRRRTMMTFWTLLGLSAGIGYLLLATPLYTASATLLIDTRKPDNGLQQSVILGNDPATDSAIVDSQVEVIQSQDISKFVINRLDLLQDPEFVGKTPGPIGRTIDRAKTWLRSLFGDGSEANAPAVDPLLIAVQEFGGKLSVRRSGISYVLELSVVAENPQKAATIANAIGEAYINDALNAKFQATERAVLWLRDRIGDLREKTLNAERLVQEYKSDNKIVDTGGGKLISDQRVEQLSSQLNAARAQTADVQARIARLDAFGAAESTAENTDSLKSDIIVKLRQEYLDISKKEADWSRRYGPDHAVVTNLRAEMADLQHSIDQEVSRISNAYLSEYEISKTREAQLQSNLNEAIAQSSSTDQSRLGLRELEASAQSLRALYDSFVTKYTETLQRQSFPITEARVITQATPPLSKSSPKTMIILPASLLLGLIFGAMFGFAQDHLDRVFRSPAQIESILGLSCLGLVPIVERDEKSDQPRGPTPPSLKEIAVSPGAEAMRYGIESPFSRFAETIRGVKVAVDLRNIAGPTQVIGITSALPREGKSTFSANLAFLMADAGAQTLLIDLDLRNPSLTRSLAAHRPLGLLEVLSGQVQVEDAIIEAPQVGLHLLPAVIRAGIPHTHEVASSLPMQRLLASMRKQYQYIILDLPPVSPVVDVRAIAPMLDSAVLIIEWGRTRQEIIMEAIASSGLANDKLLGAVLNKVNMPVYRRYADIPLDYYGEQYYEET